MRNGSLSSNDSTEPDKLSRRRVLAFVAVATAAKLLPPIARPATVEPLSWDFTENRGVVVAVFNPWQETTTLVREVLDRMRADISNTFIIPRELLERS